MKKFSLIMLLFCLLVLFGATAASASVTPEEQADYPQLLNTAPTASGITVSWNAYPDAAQYRLFYRGTDGWVRIGDTAATSYTHTGLISGTSYRYTVRALNSSGMYASSYDREGLTATFYAVPQLHPVTNENSGQRVSWDAVDGIGSYKVYVKNGASWRSIGMTAKASFLNQDVQPGVSYTYTVRCYTDDGTAPLSYYDRSGTAAVFVAPPSITACTPVDGGNKLTWTASSGATAYRLFTKRADGSWARVAETTATSYTHLGLRNDTTFTYTVRAFNGYGTAVSGFDSTGVTATYHSIPQLNAVTSVYGGQRVSWTAVPGAVNYKVYIKNGTSWRSIGTTANDTFLYRSAVSGASYTYTVRCYTADGAAPQSYYDKKGVTAVYYAAPAITGFTPADDGTHITWSAVEGADHYRLFSLTDSGWKTVATIAANELTHTGLSNGTTYTYTVRALDRSGAFISGYDPNGWQNTYFAIPAIDGISFDDGGYTVRWSKSEGVIGYQLYRKTPGAAWKLLLNTRKRTEFTDSSVLPDVPYSYLLCYVNREENPLHVVPVNMTYYLNGAPADGEIEWNDHTLSFSDGCLRQGYVTVEGRMYYYDQAGVMMKSGIVGSDSEGYTYADINGVCCTSEEIRLAADFMMKHAEGDTLDEKMKTGYLYLAHQFPYHRTYDHPSKASDMPALAIDMFTNECGNCYRYAACFACIARIAGYRARVVLGTTGGNPHGWVEVLVNGKWLICDPDAEIPKYNNPDYTAYMMTSHYWQLTPKTRCEITIDENGCAVWK